MIYDLSVKNISKYEKVVTISKSINLFLELHKNSQEHKWITLNIYSDIMESPDSQQLSVLEPYQIATSYCGEHARLYWTH